MRNYCRQYPEIYRKNNDSYLYYGDDGTPFRLIAGQDGVTEEWIAFLKAEHRSCYNADRRAERIRWNGEKYVSTVISIDAFGTDFAEQVLGLVDPEPTGENAIIIVEQTAEFRDRFAAVWAALSAKQQELIIDVRIRKIPQKVIAERDGVDCTAIRDRLRVIDRKLEKNISRYFFRK